MNTGMTDANKAYSDKEILSDLKSEKKAVRDKALEKVYVKNFPIIQGFIKKNNGNNEDAADIFQNAILIFYKKVCSGNLKLTCSIGTYVYSICRNLWMDELRSKKKNQTLISELEVVEIEEDEQIVDDIDGKIDLIAKLMNQIGADCKKMLRLFYFDRLRMKAIAIEMGYANEKVAKNLKGRCIKKLKALAAEAYS